MVKLYLDDERTPQNSNEWFIVRNFTDFKSWIKKYNLPDLISFDHDLGPEHYEDLLSNENWSKDNKNIKLKYGEYNEKTGYHCLLWLIGFCLEMGYKLPECKFHTFNPVGKRNMQQLYDNFTQMKEVHDGESA